jgi:hypothetical protein
VIGDGSVSGGAQRLGQRLRPGAGAALDDPGPAPAGGGEGEDLVARPVLRGEGEADVRPVEAAQDDARGPPGKGRATSSSRVSGSAVAVKAASGTPGAARTSAVSPSVLPEVIAPASTPSARSALT